MAAAGRRIEFGERAAETLRREFREEVGLEIVEPRLLVVIENRYEQHGARGHDIAIVFETAFAHAEAYQQETFEFREAASTARHDGSTSAASAAASGSCFRSA